MLFRTCKQTKKILGNFKDEYVVLFKMQQSTKLSPIRERGNQLIDISL